MNLAVETLNQRLTVVRHRGADADARCPAHDDRSASLTFAPGEHGGAVIKCHAGCDTADVLKAIGMSFSDISPEPHVVARYEYRDEAGELRWVTERWEPKDFRQRGLPKTKADRVLYHSEWLPQARADDRTIYVVEGEKDADNLAAVGEIAVCCVNGAGSWLDHYADQLAGMDVIVIADNDEPGKAHARQVHASLDGKAERVSLALPSYGKDISDQLDAGYGLDTLVPLSATATLGVHRVDQIRERPISWLWPGFIPTGKLVMIDGDPGDGKSVMTCDLAARFSTGAKLPDGQRSPLGPCDVVMISAEDDPEDTIKPRLRVAGADQRRVHLVTEGTIPDLPFNLSRDLPALEAFVREHEVGLIVIDPLMAFIPAEIDSYRDADVRRVLHPLTSMGQRTGVSIIVVRHLTKGRSKAITAGGGSIGFVGAARVGYLVGPHPEDETKRVLAGVKINIGPMPPTLGYKVVSSIPGDRYAPPMIAWDAEPLRITAQEVLDGGVDEEERDTRNEARDWLKEFLCANHSGASWVDITRAGKREGHSEITLRRVRKAVAHAERNPLDRDGNPRNGTFWFVNKVDRAHLSVVPDPDDEDEDEEGASPGPRRPAGTPEAHFRTSPRSAGNADDGTPPAPVVEFRPPPPEGDDCDICGGKPAVWFDSERVRRCASHNPMLYGG